MKKLRVRLPRFYEECLSCFAQCSVASRMNSYDISQETLSEVIIWNNKHICVDGKSVYNRRLVDKGIISLGDLALGKNGLAPWCDFWKLDISPLDAFQLIALCDALPTEYRQSLQIYQYVNLEPFDSENHTQLCLNGQNVALSKVVSKAVYKELRSSVIKQPTAQSKYEAEYANVVLDWKKIYSLPFTVAMDSKTRQFQYKILNRYLVTNVYLKKVGIKLSSDCSFCEDADESLEHLFTSCPYVLSFWKDLSDWLNDLGVKVYLLTKADIIFGSWERKDDFLFFNHVLLIAKQYVYYCRINALVLSLRVCTSRIKAVYELETAISKSGKSLAFHLQKWGKYCRQGV